MVKGKSSVATRGLGMEAAGPLAAAMALVAAGVLSACGQKGPLSLPKAQAQAQTQVQTQPQAAPASAPTASVAASR